MKKEDKEILSKLKTKLEDFDISNPLPLELSKENITEVLKQQPAPAKKQGKLIEIRYLASIAAAIIIVFGAVTAFNIFDGSSRIRLAIDAHNADTTTNHVNIVSTTKNDGQTTTDAKKPESSTKAENKATTSAAEKLPVKPSKEVLKAAGITSPKSYKEIFTIFKKLSKDAARDVYASGDVVMGMEKSLSESAPQTQADSASGNTAQDSTYGETNVQVKGIDEPDVMKNDGKYLYTVNSGNEINIFSLLPADNMKLTTTIKFAEKEGRSEYANSLFVKGNLLVVFSNLNTYRVFEETTTVPEQTKPSETTVTGSSGQSSTEPSKADETAKAAAPDSKMIAPYYPGYYYSKNESVCTVYDISNKAAPKEIKKISQDGSYITARLIGSELYILTSYYVDLYMKDHLEDICIPAITIDGKSKTIPAEDINIAKAPEPSYLVVCGVNLDNLSAEPDTKAVLGGGSEAYCTRDSLFASRTVYTGGNQIRDWSGDGVVSSSDYSYSTEIFRFAIGGGKVEFKNSGKVSGSILNQFSMDEYNGYFRIATTEGEWGKTSSNVFVLNSKLDVVGKIVNIAPKEQIFAVRFMGETGYVVTFEQKDPLFILDLSNPVAPKITGELKIPGFSSYLHPISGTLLLGIGQNGNNDGTTPGIKLSLFDVSNPEKPKEIDKFIVEGDSYTEAMYNHKAFMTYPQKELFGFPVVRYNYQTSGSDGAAIYNNGLDSSFNTYTVKNNKIVPVKNYKEAVQQSAENSYYYGGISRGTYINNTMYTLSGAALTSYSMETAAALDTLKIAQPIYNYYDYGIKQPMLMD